MGRGRSDHWHRGHACCLRWPLRPHECLWSHVTRGSVSVQLVQDEQFTRPQQFLQLVSQSVRFVYYIVYQLLSVGTLVKFSIVSIKGKHRKKTQFLKHIFLSTEDTSKMNNCIAMFSLKLFYFCSKNTKLGTWAFQSVWVKNVTKRNNSRPLLLIKVSIFSSEFSDIRIVFFLEFLWFTFRTWKFTEKYQESLL